MPPLTGEQWCWSHHPDQRAARHDARIRGGQRSRGSNASPAPADVDLTSLPGRFELLEHVLRDTLQQPNCPARSRALAGLLRLANDMDQQAEAIEIAEQLQALTRLVDQQERANHGY
jgi:hypothetical protein